MISPAELARCGLLISELRRAKRHKVEYNYENDEMQRRKISKKERRKQVEDLIASATSDNSNSTMNVTTMINSNDNNNNTATTTTTTTTEPSSTGATTTTTTTSATTATTSTTTTSPRSSRATRRAQQQRKLAVPEQYTSDVQHVDLRERRALPVNVSHAAASRHEQTLARSAAAASVADRVGGGDETWDIYEATYDSGSRKVRTPTRAFCSIVFNSRLSRMCRLVKTDRWILARLASAECASRSLRRLRSRSRLCGIRARLAWCFT
jgi:hypothetical protein